MSPTISFALYGRARAFAFLSDTGWDDALEALAAGVPPLLLTPVARESCGDAALRRAAICRTADALEQILGRGHAVTFARCGARGTGQIQLAACHDTLADERQAGGSGGG
jgi:hypothetical protein